MDGRINPSARWENAPADWALTIYGLLTEANVKVCSVDSDADKDNIEQMLWNQKMGWACKRKQHLHLIKPSNFQNKNKKFKIDPKTTL